MLTLLNYSKSFINPGSDTVTVSCQNCQDFQLITFISNCIYFLILYSSLTLFGKQHWRTPWTNLVYGSLKIFWEWLKFYTCLSQSCRILLNATELVSAILFVYFEKDVPDR